MTRRCSHCSNNGHNSRTCPAARLGSGGSGSGSGSGSGGVRLFGVRLTEGVGSMKKSASMGNLNLSSPSSPNNNPGSPGSDPTRDHERSGYASDDPTHTSCSSSNSHSERKKGTPWTEEEHKMFLLGLQKLGKGDWRGIARNFVLTRTPTQVASHAQKYFIRQTNASRRKRRSSLFDMIPEMQMDQLPVLDEQMLRTPPNEPENANQLPSLQLRQDQEPEPAEPSLNKPPLELKESTPYSSIPLLPPAPAFFPTFIPLPYPFWPPALVLPSKDVMVEAHEVLKPTPVLPKEPRNVDEVAGMSKLSIGEGMPGRMEPSALSHKLLEASPSRQSAFHANSTVAVADLNPSNGSPIHAV